MEKSERSVSKTDTLCMGISQVQKGNNKSTAIAPRNRVEVGNSCSPRSWLKILTEGLHGRNVDEGLCLLTCKEIGLFLKSMSQKNISSFGQYFRRLATLNCNHMTGAIQPPALFRSDQVGLYQLSKNWGREERRDREDNHTLAHTRRKYNFPTQAHTHLRSEGSLVNQTSKRGLVSLLNIVIN